VKLAVGCCKLLDLLDVGLHELRKFSRPLLCPWIVQWIYIEVGGIRHIEFVDIMHQQKPRHKFFKRPSVEDLHFRLGIAHETAICAIDSELLQKLLSEQADCLRSFSTATR